MLASGHHWALQCLFHVDSAEHRERAEGGLIGAFDAGMQGGAEQLVHRA